MEIKKKIKSFILSSLASNSNRKIGIEEEIIIYNSNRKRLPVNSGEDFSASDLIDILNKIEKNGIYSLEPGGQVEWSSLPYDNLIKLDHAQKIKNVNFNQILDQNNLKKISYSVDPFYEPEDIDLINDKKYILMNKNMINNGTMGKWMMRNTASIQINFDFKDEQELEEMVFIADCIHPISAFLFSNSPMMNGEKVKNKNIRNIIWNNTDNSRCGNLIDHNINTSENLVNKYIDYICKVPAIFQLDRKGKAQGTSGTLIDRLKYLDNINALTDEDISSALRQIFTNVRLKNLVEIRGADRPPYGYEMAPVSFWTGLLTVESIRSEIIKEIKNWKYEDRIRFNESSLILNDSKLTIKNKKYSYWNKWFGELALQGLKERGLGEEVLFKEFFNIVMTKGPFSLQHQLK